MISDMVCRSTDGLTLLITSSDGFCSCLTFSPGELGQAYHGSHAKHNPSHINTSVSSSQSTPTPTPTASVPLAKQNSSSGYAASPSLFAQGRPSSPARSMSASSIATQSSFAPVPEQGGVMMTNATPLMSSVPSVAAAPHGSVGGMPLWTPPQTPMGSGAVGGSHSAASSVSGVVGFGTKKDSDAKRESESERDEPRDRRKRDAESEGQEHGQKRRRIAPTPVSDSESSAAAAKAVVVTPQKQPEQG